MTSRVESMICPVKFTMEILSGKWKILILWYIHDNEVIRYGELKKSIPDISHKMLSKQLTSLENDSIINKKIYNQIPPKVEYSLSKIGEDLIPILCLMYDFGKKHS